MPLTDDRLATHLAKWLTQLPTSATHLTVRQGATAPDPVPLVPPTELPKDREKFHDIAYGLADLLQESANNDGTNRYWIEADRSVKGVLDPVARMRIKVTAVDVQQTNTPDPTGIQSAITLYQNQIEKLMGHNERLQSTLIQRDEQVARDRESFFASFRNQHDSDARQISKLTAELEAARNTITTVKDENDEITREAAKVLKSVEEKTEDTVGDRVKDMFFGAVQEAVADTIKKHAGPLVDNFMKNMTDAGKEDAPKEPPPPNAADDDDDDDDAQPAAGNA